MFIGPGAEVFKGQFVGIHQRPGDLSFNVCKKKAAATNVRSHKDQTVVLDIPLDYSLDGCIEYIQEDELVEESILVKLIRIQYKPHASMAKFIPFLLPLMPFFSAPSRKSIKALFT
ncbi:hypothetical protein NC651_035137 [Populus alba x Populus x berolinensis]|nr:hypothetical protein NC651_035137 [Populus alba x Populus x berolinensis]